MQGRVSAFLPVLAVLVILILLGYPLALVFGLPLALRDMRDLRKWDKVTVTAQPPDRLEGEAYTFATASEDGVLVKDDAPVNVSYTQTGDTVTLAEPVPALVTWGDTLTPVSETLYRYEGDLPDLPTLYVGDTLAVGSATPAAQTPDDVRVNFSFGDALGPVLLDDAVLTEGADYTQQGGTVTFTEAPSFGSDLRRVSSDYAVLDETEGTVIFAAPPLGEVRAAESVVRLAERLSGDTDGTNQHFTLSQAPVVETEPYDIYVGNTPLPSDAERPEERVDGQRATFTFESTEGIVVVDDKPQTEGDYTRSGNTVTFTRPPVRNAQLRQYAGAFLSDSETGEVLLASAPSVGATVWVDTYTVYSQPGCGMNVLECFLALPQHPVPFPHWIAARVVPFFNKFPLADERNVVRAVVYTAAGTLSALALGGAVGTLLAVLFVMVRPLERALLPWLVASQTVPIIALVPVLLLILGNVGITIQTSLLPTALIGAYIAFFPVVVGTVKGLRSVDPLALDLMKSYAATPLQVFAKVRFPAAVPFLFTALKLAAAAALVGALVAETESNNRRGLGFQILGQVQSGNVADVWILLLVSALLGVGLVALVGIVQRVVAPWERL